MTTGRATCIVFSYDDLPLEGSDHTRPLYIYVGCLGNRVPSVLLDNGSALNICPLAIAIALGYAPSDFGPSTQTVRAYDNTQIEVMGTLEIELLIECLSCHTGAYSPLSSVEMIVFSETYYNPHYSIEGCLFTLMVTVSIDFCRNEPSVEHDLRGLAILLSMTL